MERAHSLALAAICAHCALHALHAQEGYLFSIAIHPDSIIKPRISTTMLAYNAARTRMMSTKGLGSGSFSIVTMYLMVAPLYTMTSRPFPVFRGVMSITSGNIADSGTTTWRIARAVVTLMSATCAAALT